MIPNFNTGQMVTQVAKFDLLSDNEVRSLNRLLLSGVKIVSTENKAIAGTAPNNEGDGGSEPQLIRIVTYLVDEEIARNGQRI